MLHQPRKTFVQRPSFIFGTQMKIFSIKFERWITNVNHIGTLWDRNLTAQKVIEENV